MDKFLEQAELILENKLNFIHPWDMERCETVYSIPNSWNETPNGDDEWIYMRARLGYFDGLILKYTLTKDIKYVEKIKKIISNFITHHKILKYEKLGIKYNVEQIIKTKLSDAINKNEYKIAESLIKKLPNKNDKKEFLRILSYNKAIKYSKENKSQLAIKNYITAYNNGMHDLDIHIVNEYLRINDYENALKWLKIADKNGKKEANYQLALIYYKNNLYEKAIKYLKIQYDRGNTELALSIGVCYAKLNNFDEAIKWFKIAKTHGNAEADKFIKEINSYIKGSYIVE